ncbi:ATP-binding protein [Aureibacter tunicatorum]|uniref:SpoVK/Ycf46/Vps4 family AAA+-type ATPase n=1 Tax=Aureibacter tunicatorum TaxID=866807 RepID=A0AAE3XSQ9_9BACT|nr:ATP-binding protein [Aureibacter tunicatorum]MDR6241897.1 SpoVK/Ycf46/Vps4 family AAA+-type ATPase [Aureibacter tunicatorum]BDD07446.1 hypothetical protein AUTU_49290 [Aureibacter tunicatorum]
MSTAEQLFEEFKWIKKIFEARNQDKSTDFHLLAEDNLLPEISNTSYQSIFKETNEEDPYQRLLLALSLAATACPAIIDIFKNPSNDFALYLSPEGFALPTNETFLRMATGENYQHRISIQQAYTSSSNPMVSNHWLRLAEVDIKATESPLFKPLEPTSKLLKMLDLQNDSQEQQSMENEQEKFPAKLITTKLEWSDIVFNSKTSEKLNEAVSYHYHKDTLAQEMGFGKHMKKGIRIIFHGPSGTGKTLTATALGKKLGKPVYRVDVPNIVSKYIGETNKNLEQLFAMAEGKDWILFFDEGDALLGKRSSQQSDHKSSHYANQEIAYLLQRIEDFDGIIIIATNLKQNMDSAFMRRFELSIPFELPDYENRQKLWETYWPSRLQKSDDLDLTQIVKANKLSAASIINVLKRISLKCILSKNMIVHKELLESCIDEERYK